MAAMKRCWGCSGRGGHTESRIRPGSFDYDHVWIGCGACGGSGMIFSPDPSPPITPVKTPRKKPHVEKPPPVPGPERRLFPALDAWFDRTFPTTRRRRINGVLGVTGGLLGYGYSTSIGASAVGWVLGGAIAGYVALVVAFLALKLLLVALILGVVATALFLAYSMLAA